MSVAIITLSALDCFGGDNMYICIEMIVKIIGGSWYNFDDYCQVTHNGFSGGSDKDNDVGFRLCLV